MAKQKAWQLNIAKLSKIKEDTSYLEPTLCLSSL